SRNESGCQCQPQVNRFEARFLAHRFDVAPISFHLGSLSRYFCWPIGTGWFSESNHEAIPAIDRDYSEAQICEFLFRKLQSNSFVDLIWHMYFFDQRERVRPLQRCSFFIAVEGCLASDAQSIQPVLAFAGSTCILRVHVDAVSASIHQGCANKNQIQQRML